ncbi:unnamed protein product [Schistosoma guineensis]|nr:unnamed protein product [Schistosoma intercalatum]CAH8548780.1 unnamed protein product [Schistosoma intercalatum]CAH8558593.1 unnamed protein product [Schistosoma guineensis]CAH8564371.1 unnamed protein product [Schistosoma bovis]
MCRWGCQANDTTYMCKWCGTRFCKVCLVGDFQGKMKAEDHCFVCNQLRCIGKRVEYVPSTKKPETKSIKKGGARKSKKKTGKSAKKTGKSKKKKK